MPAWGPTEKESNVNGMKAYCSKFHSNVVRYRVIDKETSYTVKIINSLLVRSVIRGNNLQGLETRFFYYVFERY